MGKIVGKTFPAPAAEPVSEQPAEQNERPAEQSESKLEKGKK